MADFFFFLGSLLSASHSFLKNQSTLKYTKEFREEKAENCRQTMSCIAGEKKDLLLKN